MKTEPENLGLGVFDWEVGRMQSLGHSRECGQGWGFQKLPRAHPGGELL